MNCCVLNFRVVRRTSIYLCLFLLATFDSDAFFQSNDSRCSWIPTRLTTFSSKLSAQLQSHGCMTTVDGTRESDGTAHALQNDVDEWQARQNYLRFSAVGRLYADSSSPVASDRKHHVDIIDRLAASTICVMGLGGVGSWAAEALCRSGVGNLILVDLDDVCISNTNRQVHALASTVGRLKVEEMKKRLFDANPSCNITTIQNFLTQHSVDLILDSMIPEIDVCLDAIDGTFEKSALIAGCVRRSIPIVTCGGAAGRRDPTKIRCHDLSRARDDKLLSKCRKVLRKEYGFRKGKRTRKWKIPAVYSQEISRKIISQDGSFSVNRCDGPLGTACHVTGTFGFVAASRVMDIILS